MAFSVSASIKTPKVDAGRAPNAHSMARLQPEFASCQVRPAVDDYGRPAPYTSLKTTSGFDACTSASLRIEAENNLRPKYFTYLPAIGMDPSQLEQQRRVRVGHDLLLGGNPGRDQTFRPPSEVANSNNNSVRSQANKTNNSGNGDKD